MWNLYTDGGCRPNPGNASYSAALYNVNELYESIGGYIGQGTNNKAEYRAFLSGLYLLENNCKYEDNIECHLDSQLIIKQLTNVWKVKDKELLIISDKCKVIVAKFQNIKFNWVKGHSGNKGNEYVDSVCTYFIKKQDSEKSDSESEHEEEYETDDEQLYGMLANKIESDKLYINCPFSEKDEVKSLGAKWDANEKKWWIKPNMNVVFKKWL